MISLGSQYLVIITGDVFWYQFSKYVYSYFFSLCSFLLQFSLAVNPAFYLHMVKKQWRHISFFSKCCSKHPNNNNKTFQFRSSTSVQHHLHDWYSGLRYNSDQVKLELPLLYNFTLMLDLSEKGKLFSSAVAKYASSSDKATTVKTDLLQINIKFSWILPKYWHILPLFLFFTCRIW